MATRNGKEFNENVWGKENGTGNSKGQYIVRDSDGKMIEKTQMSTTKPGQIDRYTFDSDGNHDHYGINSDGTPFVAHKNYRK